MHCPSIFFFFLIDFYNETATHQRRKAGTGNVEARDSVAATTESGVLAVENGTTTGTGNADGKEMEIYFKWQLKGESENPKT